MPADWLVLSWKSLEAREKCGLSNQLASVFAASCWLLLGGISSLQSKDSVS